MSNRKRQSKTTQKVLFTLFFLLLISQILTHAGLSLFYAQNSLRLWAQNMVPALLPFMILSGIMVRMGLTEAFSSLLHPLIAPLWQVRKNVTYAMIMGFLCGFPMGARVTSELLEQNLISEEEGNFLLSFCNNIGPVYFLSYALPLLGRQKRLPYLFGMYGIPLLYGLFLRHTVYRHRLPSEKGNPFSKTNLYTGRRPKTSEGNPGKADLLSFLEEMDNSIHAAIQSILTLGGVMIFFNLLNLIPDWLFSKLQSLTLLIGQFSDGRLRYLSHINVLTGTASHLLAPVLEITGGLQILGDQMPLCSLIFLSFGGFSCIAQTYSTIRGTPLSLSCYLVHKLVLAGLSAVYYGAWAILSPSTFLL